MTDFAKVQSYAIRSAVIALAVADAASYFVINRHINEPVSYSDEVTDLIDSENTVRLGSAGLAKAAPVLPAPSAFAANAVTSQPVPLPLPAPVDAPIALLPANEAVTEIPARTRPLAIKDASRRAKGSNSIPVRRGAGAMSFSQAFAGYPEADGAAIVPTSEIRTAAAADLADPLLQPDNVQGLDGADTTAETLQAAANQRLNSISDDASEELPALDSKPDDPAAIDQVIEATVADAGAEIGDPSGAIKRVFAAAAAILPPDPAPAPRFVAEPPKAAASVQDLRVTAAIERMLPRTKRKVNPAAGSSAGSRQLSMHPVGNRHPAPARQASLPGSAGFAAITGQLAKSTECDPVLASLGPNGEAALCLRDVLIALRPLMSDAEFEWLMRAQNSAALVSLATLRTAGIAVEYDPVAGKVRFA